MTNKWQDNQSWKSGLLSEFPVSRLKAVRGTAITEILVLKKQSAKLPPHPNNLVHETTLRNNSPEKTIWLSSPDQFIYVAVDLRRRATEVVCKLGKLDVSVTLQVDYRVTDARKVVMDNEDVLANLAVSCQNCVNRFVSRNPHGQIHIDQLTQEVRLMDTSYLGLIIERVTNLHSINLPTNFTKSLEINCEFTTRDYVTGSIEIVIDYRYISIHAIGNDEQGLVYRLTLECQAAVIEAMRGLDYKQIHTHLISEKIKKLEVAHFGVALEKVLTPYPILWPGIVPVDGRRQTVEVSCIFMTSDAIEGRLTAYMEYQANDPQKVMMQNEAIPNWLSIQCRTIVTSFTERLPRTKIFVSEIEEKLNQIDTSYMGITIEKVSIPDFIIWPSTIGDMVSEEAINRERNELLQEKLRLIGVTHPLAVMRVLARHDSDLKAIFEPIEHLDKLEREQKEKALQILLDLDKRDRITRDQLGGLIENLVEAVSKDITKSPEAVVSFFTAPSSSAKLTGGQEDKVGAKPEPQNSQNPETPKNSQDATDVKTDTDNSVSTHSVTERRRSSGASDNSSSSSEEISDENHYVSRRPAKPQ